MQTTVRFEDLAKEIAVCRDEFLNYKDDPSDSYKQLWRGKEMGTRAIVEMLIDDYVSVFHDLDKWSITVKIGDHEFTFDRSEL